MYTSITSYRFLYNVIYIYVSDRILGFVDPAHSPPTTPHPSPPGPRPRLLCGGPPQGGGGGWDLKEKLRLEANVFCFALFGWWGANN